MANIQWIKLISSIIISNLAGFIGAFFTVTAINSWYSTLVKPSFNPPNEIFGPVWTLLYTLMGISLYIIWTHTEKNKKLQYTFFFTQLILNSLWSILFFGVKSPLSAFIEIIFLNIAIIGTIITFWKISKPAAGLLIPYICWTLFATVLNLFIVLLN